MNPDDYDEFTAWKKGLNELYSNAYLKRHSSDYFRWKEANKIDNYEEKTLMKLYELERKVETLEAILYKSLD